MQTLHVHDRTHVLLRVFVNDIDFTVLKLAIGDEHQIIGLNPYAMLHLATNDPQGLQSVAHLYATPTVTYHFCHQRIVLILLGKYEFYFTLRILSTLISLAGTFVLTHLHTNT